MRKNWFNKLLAAGMLVATTTAMAAPAWRSKRIITLPDGSKKEVMLCGDENKHFYIDAEENAYLCDENGKFGKADLTQIKAEWNKRLAERNARRIERGIARGLIDRETGMHTAAISRTSREGVRRAQWGAASNPISGSKKGIVILVNYSDTKLQTNHTQSFYNDFFNKEGFSEEKAHGSVHDYFKECSYGQFDLTFDVVGPVTVSRTLGYYGANDSNGNDLYPATLVAEACKLADAQGVDFSKYDWDGDGYVDQVFVVYAGYGENVDAASNTIWPHESTLSAAAKYNDGQGALTLDGVKVDTYAMSSELAGKSGTMVSGIGMACHEFSHCMCIPDMYDLYGQNFGMFSWDLLDYGSYSGDYINDMYPCCNYPAPYTSYERMYCGWLTPKELKDGCVVQGMKAIGDEPEAYIIYNDKNRNEYYLLENRQRKGFYTADPAHGLLVLHVDFDSKAWTDNMVNTGSLQRCTIIPADGAATYETLTGDTWPGKSGNTALTDTSKPAATLNTANADGRKLMGKPIEYIVEEDGLISFSFCGGMKIDTPTAQEATELGRNTFRANWTAVDGATEYEVELQADDQEANRYMLSEVATMMEDFSGFNNGGTANGTVDCSANLDDYTKMPGWEGSDIYTTPRNEIRLGTSRGKQIVGGQIISPWLPTATKTVTVTFVVRSYSTDKEPLYLYMGEGDEGAAVGKITLEKDPVRYVVTADSDLDEWWWGLACEARCYVSEMSAYDGHVTEEQIEEGYIEDKRTELSQAKTAETSYLFTDLPEGKNYSYRVRAYVNKAASSWSERVAVDLSTGIRTEYITIKNQHKTYDLQGREVKAPRRGLYIRNGKIIMHNS